MICKFWSDPEFDLKAFHQVTMKLLPKKGDLTDPNKWRAICLQEVLSKIVSSLIQSRLVQHNKTFKKEAQNGFWPGRGTADGVATLKLALQTMREFGKDSYVLFVDLVKAFDSVNREMMPLVLEKYGVPQSLITVIMKMYTNIWIKFDIESVRKSIASTSGVKQGDNLAPVLFLYMVQAVIDTWESQRAAHNLQDLPLRWMKPTIAGTDRGQLVSAAWKNKGSSFNISETLYADDAAFCFGTKEELCEGAKLLRKIFSDFGLNIHIGTGLDSPHVKQSKTVAMFFPGAGSSTDVTSAELPIIFESDDGQHIPFVKDVCYLGCIVDTALRDDLDVNNRTRLAKGTLANLKGFLRTKSVPLKAKTKAFHSFTVSVLLAGCESWSLNADQIAKLKTVYNDGLRAILNLARFRAHCCMRLTTEDLERACELPSLENVLHLRKAKWLQKIALMSPDRAPRKLIGAWVRNPRPTGRPQKAAKHGHLETVKLLLGEQADEFGKLNNWMPLARDKKAGTLSAKWHSRKRSNPTGEFNFWFAARPGA